MEGHLDLNQHLIRHQAATYFARVRGDSMQEAGIQDGDLLIIDRALTPASGLVVVAVVDGEFTVKRLRLARGRVWLEPANPKYQPQEILPGMNFSVRGVVTHVIHSMNTTAGLRAGDGNQISAE
ncbi:LexA family protein [Hymenobacter lutimineralis]|uniref:LexA family protein n=1 Tax=Hymenobacter lutimineralis TaxID=2606448 RepID=UPI001CA43F6A|nr:translesion error-prone DNA polymerase V autoproteolytic subunit [Hymenobacter lutimineralis]